MVTALFADLKGSTALMEGLDPEEAHAIVAPALRIMAEAVRRYEGYLARTTGDGIFAIFGAPVAYEDHPQRALYAALEIQRELRVHGQQRTARGLRFLDARIGVHTGEVVAYAVETSGKLEYRLIGHAANLASRLETLAPVGSIATSEYTRGLCEGYFELRGLGQTTVKGLSAPIELYEVIGLGPLRTHFQLAVRRGLTRFVGRERELEQMRRALAQTVGGHGQVVAVMAEVGTGKSRLFHEFKATIPATCKVLEAYSVSHGKASAWLPALELLRGYFGIQDADDADSRREKVRQALAALDPALQDALPYLFGLFGIVEGADPLAQMDPQIKRQRTLDAIKRVVFSESLKQPVIVIFEDLHWIDAQTQALLDLLADGLARVSVLLLANYRPEYRHEWANKSYYSQLRLDPLGGAEGDAMLTALLGESVELNPLKRLITERTGGNPFFIEEIVRALFDEGALTKNGAAKVARSLSQLRLPATVQGMLAARIGRLPGEHQQLLQTLAVIGRESSVGLLRQVASQTDADLQHSLAALQAGEFVYEQPTATDVEYVFKHALTQEVAYNSLLIERRKQLHERTGQAIESLFADHLDDQLPQLAHHYRHSDNADKAIEYLWLAGEQATKRSANSDAIDNITSALDLLRKLADSSERDRRELGMRLALGPALIAIKSWAAPEVERVFIRARELCERIGESQQLFATLFGLYAVYHVRGRFRMASVLASELLQRAQDTKDSALVMLAHLAMGDTSFEMGQFALSLHHLDAAIGLYIPEHHRAFAFGFIGLDIKVNCLSYAALDLWYLGYPDQAIERAKTAIAWGRDLSHPHSLAFAVGLTGNLRKHRREVQAVKTGAEHLLAFSAEHGFTLWAAQAAVQLGWAMAEQGQEADGIARMRDGLVAFRTAGADIGRPYFLSLLVEACIRAGRLAEGRNLLDEAQTLAEQNENCSDDAELLRLNGELLLKQNDSEGARGRRYYERAIHVARDQGTKSNELRATTSLARLLNKQGNRDEARTMLAEIYNWFTEGFDTADLKDAKALLDELGT